MRQDRVKQVIGSSEKTAADFEERMNESLYGLVDPEITFYPSIPFTAVITFRASRDIAEDVLEMFEMVDGGHHTCSECPYFVVPEDKRKVWSDCSKSNTKTRADSRCCEKYYVSRYRMLSEAAEAYKLIPFKPE